MKKLFFAAILGLVLTSTFANACNTATIGFESKIQKDEDVVLTRDITVDDRVWRAGLQFTKAEFMSLPCEIKDAMVRRHILKVLPRR